MLIDSKGKLFGKISIVDVLIVVMVLGVLAGVGYKFRKSGTSTPFAKKDTVQVTFYHYEVNDFIDGSIKVGDPVKDKATGTVFGKVSSVKFDKAISTGTNSEGQMVAASNPKFRSVTITVDGEGVFGDQGVSFDSTSYFVGSSVEIRVGNSTLWAFVKNLQKKG